MSVLHPNIDIKVGNTSFNIPPEYVQEFTEVNRLGLSTVTIKLIDPTFIDLEYAVIDADKKGGIVQYRWGYPDVPRYTPWKQIAITNILPDISDTYTLTITGQSAVARSTTKITPKTYKGKISEVVRQIVNDINKESEKQGIREITKTFIEETDDDSNIDKEWFTGNLSLISFIRQKLQPFAKSKTSKKGTYNFFIDTTGAFHFRTYEFKNAPGVKYRQIQTLFGVPMGAISFRPDYIPSVIANQSRGWVTATYDRNKGQYKEVAVNRKTVPVDDHHKKTSSPPPDKTNPSSTTTAQGFHYEPSGVSKDTKNSAAGQVAPKQALDRLENQWKLMSNRNQQATLELVGLPEYLDLTPAEQMIDIAVVLPDNSLSKGAGGQSLHWSSGRYKIMSVTHSILLGSYTISVELHKGSSLSGTDFSKSSPI